jgi:hypothetical protein
MRANIFLATVLLVTGFSGAAAANEAAMTPVAKTTDCLDLIRIDRTEIIDNKTIIFHMDGKAKWRNDLPYSCPQLKWEDKFLFKTSINRICSVDTITVLSTIGGGFQQGPTCGLGKFTALDEPSYKAMKDKIKADKEARKAARALR